MTSHTDRLLVTSPALSSRGPSTTQVTPPALVAPRLTATTMHPVPKPARARPIKTTGRSSIIPHPGAATCQRALAQALPGQRNALRPFGPSLDESGQNPTTTQDHARLVSTERLRHTGRLPHPRHAPSRRNDNSSQCGPRLRCSVLRDGPLQRNTRRPAPTLILPRQSDGPTHPRPTQLGTTAHVSNQPSPDRTQQGTPYHNDKEHQHRGNLRRTDQGLH